MTTSTCPKCGNAVAPAAVVCPVCDCILDLSFLEMPDDAVTTDAHGFEDEKTGSEIAADLFDEKTGATPLVAEDGDEGGDTDDAPTIGDALEDAPVRGGVLPIATSADELVATIGDVVDEFELSSDAPLVDDDIVAALPSQNDDRGAYGGEAIILGNVGGANDFESMLSDATSSIPLGLDGGLARVFEPAPVYVSQSVQRMTEPDAVLALREGANVAVLQLSPFEQHVLSFIDGQRPVARIRKKAGLGASDLKIAIGMLSDRNLIVVKGHIKPDAQPDVRSLLDAGDLDESGEFPITPSESDANDDEAIFDDDDGVASAPKADDAEEVVEDLPLDAMMALPAPARTTPDAVGGIEAGDELAAAQAALGPSDLVDDDSSDHGLEARFVDRVEAPAVSPARTRTPPPAQATDADAESVFSGAPNVRAAGIRAAAPAPALRSESKAAAKPAPSATAPRPAARGGVALPSTLAAEAARRDSPPSTAAPSAPAPVSVRVAAAQGAARGAAQSATVDPASKSKALQVLELGLADLRSGKKARALMYVKMAAELDPTNEKAQLLLKDWAKADRVAMAESEDQLLVADAQRAEEQGQFDHAAALYRKAIVLKPNEAELYNRLGIVCALRLEDYSSATNALMKACELAPDNLAYRSNLGKIFKIADGGKAGTLFKGSDSEALKAQADKSKPAGLLGRLRGK